MKRGFLLRDTKLPPRQSLPTCRLATQPPARMLATERHPKGQPTTEKLPAELLATEHPGVVAHDVLCLVASQLAFFTGASPVLELCRGQDRLLWFIARLQDRIATLPLPSPISVILATHYEPTRFLVARMFFLRPRQTASSSVLSYLAYGSLHTEQVSSSTKYAANRAYRKQQG